MSDVIPSNSSEDLETHESQALPPKETKSNFFKRLGIGRINRTTFFLGMLLWWASPYLVYELVNSQIIIIQLLHTAYQIICVILVLSLCIKRFHDLGQSGWSILILLVPFVNIFYLFKLLLSQGQEEKNMYGNIPSGIQGRALIGQ